jgi:hypothetical protein
VSTGSTGGEEKAPMARRGKRVPPEGELLEFVRVTRTGRVHVLPSPPGPIERALPGPPSDAEVVNLLALAGRQPMLCGTRLIVGPDSSWQAVRTAGYAFEDDDLCPGCIRALGDQSHRAFHVDNRGEPHQSATGWRGC